MTRLIGILQVTVQSFGELGFGEVTGTSSDLRFAPATFPKGEG